MRLPRFAAAVFAAALLLGAPLAPAAGAQAPSAPAASTPTTGAPATAALSTADAPTSTGLPAEAAPPRTLRAYWHVWIAFTLAWVLLFGYVVSLGRRFGRLEREVEALGG